jgi:hypothetical protein
MLTREEILNRKKAGKTEKYDLNDGSGTVEIRALTRDQALAISTDAETLAEKDNLLIAQGLVNPAMSIEDVAAWAGDESAGVLSGLSQRIAEISGMAEGAGKSRVPRARRR